MRPLFLLGLFIQSDAEDDSNETMKHEPSTSSQAEKLSRNASIEILYCETDAKNCSYVTGEVSSVVDINSIDIRSLEFEYLHSFQETKKNESLAQEAAAEQLLQDDVIGGIVHELVSNDDNELNESLDCIGDDDGDKLSDFDFDLDYDYLFLNPIQEVKKSHYISPPLFVCFYWNAF